MKSLFAGYYRPTREEFEELWKTCTFIFDANVLLDLYRSTAKTRDVLLRILEKIKDRVWLPYQVAWEYQENRLGVIAEELELYSELRKTLDGIVKSVQQKMHNHAVESAEKIQQELEGAIEKIIAIIDQGASDHPDLTASDHIREKITTLFEGKVGKKLEEKRLAMIYQEGPKRYENKIPPGYKDLEKGGTKQFGDLVVWNEILEQARSAKRPVIFVTSDTKEDWWWRQGQFTVGPRPELVQEVAGYANVRFYMYNVQRFLNEAQERFDTKVEPTAVKKAAEEFKEIEDKREDMKPPSSSFNRLKFLAGRAASDKLPYASLDIQARAADRTNWLALLSAPASATLPAQEWVQIFEDMLGRPCSSEEIAILDNGLTNDLIKHFARNKRTGLEVATLLSVYLEALTAEKPRETKPS